MSYNYKPIDMQSEDPQSIVNILKTMRRSTEGSEHDDDYYCGIATEPDDRFADHEKRHWEIKRIVGVIDCGSKKKCCDVEKLMGEDGIDIGEAYGSGAGDDTRYVYFVEKGERIEESGNSKSIMSGISKLFGEYQKNKSKNR